MAAVAEIGAAVSPVLAAAVLLLGHEYLRVCGLTGPGVEQIITATGASRSRAYELREELRRVLPWRCMRRSAAPAVENGFACCGKESG